MFQRLGSLTYRFRFAIVVAWIVGAAAAGLLAPSLAANGQTDQTSFLPAGTDALKARAALAAAFPQDAAASSATLTFLRPTGLTDADRTYVGSVAAWVTGPAAPAALRDLVKSVATAEARPELAAMLRSPDGQLEMLQVNLTVASIGPESDTAVDLLRAHLASTAPAGLQAHVTGAAGIAADYLTAIQHGTDSATLITIVLVVLILLLIYRAPLAALVPLVTIGAAFIVSRGLLGELAAAGWKISSLLDTFIVVLIFGVGTDYTIFLISRFREEVGRSGDWHAASAATVRRIGAVITASAATVIVGLGSMAFGDYGMIQTTGPALALAIAITLLAGLTLSPALLAIFGHYVFWPRHERSHTAAGGDGLFADLASAVSRRPGLVTVLIVAVLLIPAATVPQMRTNFDVLAELPATSDARIGFDDSAAHLGRGKLMPSTAIVEVGAGTDLLAPGSLATLRDVTRSLAATPGVATVSSAIAPSGDGSVPAAFQPSKTLTTMAAGFSGSTSS
ncbi:MAG: MMPL family transporter, partial [Candidatus Limnocylindrales bacterium]